MDETYSIKAIILKREPFRESDTRVIVYTREKGRLQLVARGTKKIKSKLAGHLEPMTLANLMAVRGRAYDYVGSAVAENSFPGIKADLDKIEAAGEAIKNLLIFIKEGEKDENIFKLLVDFLESLNNKKKAISAYFFTFKLLELLGYKPELRNCVVCGKPIKTGGNKFNFLKGGLVSPYCARPGRGDAEIPISNDAIKVLRLTEASDFDQLIKLEISDILSAELSNLVRSFVKYH